MTGLYPWLGYQATDRVTVWGVALERQLEAARAAGDRHPALEAWPQPLPRAARRSAAPAPVRPGRPAAMSADSRLSEPGRGIRRPRRSRAARRSCPARHPASRSAASVGPATGPTVDEGCEPHGCDFQEPGRAIRRHLHLGEPGTVLLLKSEVSAAAAGVDRNPSATLCVASPHPRPRTTSHSREVCGVLQLRRQGRDL